MPMQFSVTISGTPDQADRRAAQYAVDQKNAQRAALNPPGNVLPSSTNAELRDSLQIVCAEILVEVHTHNLSQSHETTIQDLKRRWPDLTDAQRAAVLAALPPE